MEFKANDLLPAPSLSGLQLTTMERKDGDINLIYPNLYLGSLIAAENLDLLNKLKIKYILTLMDYPLDNKIQKEFNYKFIELKDIYSTNILDTFKECFEFIDSAVQNSHSILVHCLAGVSRSASIVIAYLMYKNKKPYNEILEFVREKRFVFPNIGFSRQLKYFEKVNFEITNLSYEDFHASKIV